jgi:hypothetical protein
MLSQRDKIIKIRMDLLIKNALSDEPVYREFDRKIKKKITKKDFNKLINERQYCKDILKSMVHRSGSDGMWNYRAYSFIDILVDSLFKIVKNLKVNISLSLIRNCMSLNNLKKLSEKEPYVYKYFNMLPAFNYKNTPDVCYEQHCYVTMQITEQLGSIFDFYKMSETQTIDSIFLSKKISNF